MAAAEVPPVAGDVLDELFRIEGHLGAGATGEVYAVALEKRWQDLPAGSRLALKWYSPRILGREPETAVMIRRLREAALGSRIRHPNLVRAFDLSELWADGRPRYLVMEHVEGRSLEDIEEVFGGGSPLATELVFSIMEQLASGVAALHAAGVIHRDIKPANIVIQPGGRAVLLDLGVARPRAEETITESRAFLGTLCYAAPEWLFGDSCGPAVDVYSVGGVLYRLLTGQGLFAELRPFARQVLAVQTVAPEIPLWHADPARAFTASLAAHMLDKKPDARPDIQEVWDFFRWRGRSSMWERIRDERSAMLVATRDKKRARLLTIGRLHRLPVEALDRRLAVLDRGTSGRLFLNRPAGLLLRPSRRRSSAFSRRETRSPLCSLTC